MHDYTCVFVWNKWKPSQWHGKNKLNVWPKKRFTIRTSHFSLCLIDSNWRNHVNHFLNLVYYLKVAREMCQTIWCGQSTNTKVNVNNEMKMFSMNFKLSDILNISLNHYFQCTSFDPDSDKQTHTHIRTLMQGIFVPSNKYSPYMLLMFGS